MATNLWTLPPDRGEETVQVLHQSQRVRVEKIVSYGQVSPEGFWYDQPEDEWVSVLEGSAVLRAGEQLVHLSRGESFFLPAHLRHRVERTSSPCIWLCVFEAGEELP